MLTCDEHRFIFYDIPKTASSSIIAFIKKSGVEYNRNGRHNFAPRCPHYADYFKFAVKINNEWKEL